MQGGVGIAVGGQGKQIQSCCWGSFRSPEVESVQLIVLGLTKVETVSDFILGGSKITADGDCRH